MKTIFIILLFTLTGAFLMGQSLTEQEAIDIADKLYKVEMLSKKGKTLLIEQIKEKRIGKFPALETTSIFSGIDEQEISSTRILMFLGIAFMNEFAHRSGLIEKYEIYRFRQATSGEKIASEKELKKMRIKLKKKFKLEKRGKKVNTFKIEEKIAAEDIPVTKNFSSIFNIGPPVSDDLLIHKNRSVMGKTRSRTLTDLYKVGLIDAKVYEDIQKLMSLDRPQDTQSFLSLNRPQVELVVIGHVIERKKYYENFEKAKTQQLALISNLHTAGILSNENKKSIFDSYKEWELKSKYEILKYANRTRLFDLSDYPVSPVDSYRKIFEEIKLMLPDSNIKNFVVNKEEINKPWYDDFTEIKLTLTFEANENQYAQTFFYENISNDSLEEANAEKKFMISPTFYKGINKWLTDQDSDVRLYYANHNKPNEGVYSEDEFGLILMSQQQYEAWETGSGDYFLSEENHSTTFNTANTQKLIEQYEEIGLFTHLTPDELTQGKQNVFSKEIKELTDILFCFPKTIVYFDWEADNLENPYEELTVEFGKASRGAFSPTNFVDNFVDNMQSETTYFSFECKGKKYEKNIVMDSDWLSQDFMSLIEKALIDNNVDGSIYYCYGNGQVAGYIFLTKSQYDFLKKEQPGLFP